MSGTRNRLALAQNFFRSAAAARTVLQHARLDSSDRVYDLGAGSGMLTHEIAKTGAQVIAVECDPNLVRKLRSRFAHARIEVLEMDIACVAFRVPYKIVANIPFNRTARVMRRLFFEDAPPEEALLVLQREAAEKYALTRRQVSLLLQPWFEADIVHRFAAHDFVPAPSVETVLLRIERRPTPLLAEHERPAWQAFVRYAFGRPKADARGSFRNLLSGLQWRLLARDLGMAQDVRLAELTLAQWLGIYRFSQRHVPPHKRGRATFAALER
ncbi:MAG TPA: rRNA adenine N(6)-methyltransferase family protein [Rhizomicrobium sp.]|jgi:16S rRNA A1518/A1519 N6-dimethyltransferase RsmA/KsgA/DIM1 with predicted DNA glycosylase/AP lyase activity